MALAGTAIAADVPVPVYKAPPVASANGWYVSLDGAWQSVRLPDYALGIRGVAAVSLTDLGVVHSFAQRHEGYLIRGAIGYLLPPGTLPFLGANTRLEIGGLYGKASGSQTVASSVGPGAGLVFLNGTGQNNALTCAGFFTCTVASAQSTDYSNWQIHGKLAADHRLGNIVLTPSLALFGGMARNNQTLAQAFTQGGAFVSAGTYNASTSMPWTDLGVRAGLDLKVDLTSSVAVSVGGFAGFARRHVSLTGTDIGTDTVGGGPLAGASAISLSADATPFIANIEGGVAWKWLKDLTVRGFVGLNYDGRVPGIVSPRYTGPRFPAGAVRFPASISFQSETSYYAGGGAIWTF